MCFYYTYIYIYIYTRIYIYIYIRDVGSYLALTFQTGQQSTIAMLLTIQVVASLGWLIVPWSIIELND